MLAAHTLKQSCLCFGATMLDAIKALNGPAPGMAIITDGDQKVVALLTDGDVRRALMQEACLDALIDPYVCHDFIFVTETESRNQVLDLMQAKQFNHIPILDSEGRLIGMHMLHDVIGGGKLSNHAVIMAGGKGVRLRPITEHLPKPMIQVAGRPILERLVLHLVGCGITSIHISVNYLAEIIVNHFGNGNRFGCEISYLRESEELGTAGGLSLLPFVPKDPVIVLNGDLVTQMDFAAMITFHVANGCAATIAHHPYTHQIPFGCLEVQHGRVISIREKPVLEYRVNTGVYVLAPEVLAMIPPRFYPITELFQNLLDRGEKIGSCEVSSDWIDVGQHTELRKARGGS